MFLRRTIISTQCYFVLLLLFMSITLFSQLHIRQDYLKIETYYESPYRCVGCTNFTSLNSKLCEAEGIKPPYRQDGDNFVENLLVKGSIQFNKSYKNPCFFQTVRYEVNNKVVGRERRLRCLPYFFIIGFPKCGTSDLWNRLTLHPDVLVRHAKESFYLDDKRFADQWTFESYLDYFSTTTEEMKDKCNNGKTSQNATKCGFITGEATANTAGVNDKWYLLEENAGCSEPRFTNADNLYNINKDMKLIVLIRDPVERLWSDHLYLAKYFNYKTSPQLFHEHAVRAIELYRECLMYFSERGCAYNESIGSIKMRLRLGLYDVHISEWLRTFKRNQLLVIRSEEYQTNIPNTLRRVLEHLNLDYPKPEIEEKMMNRPRDNVNQKKQYMLDETRELLYQFYAPSMKRLQKILLDDKH